MEKLKKVIDMPEVQVINEIKSKVTDLELLVDTKKEEIRSKTDSRIFFNRVLDFRVTGEEGFFERTFLNQEIFESGKFFEIEDSEYVKYYLSMNSAGEAIYGELKHYIILDKIGNCGVEVLSVESGYVISKV